MRYRFAYVGADLRLTSLSAEHQPILRDRGYGLVYHVVCPLTPPAFAILRLG